MYFREGDSEIKDMEAWKSDKILKDQNVKGFVCQANSKFYFEAWKFGKSKVAWSRF